MYLPRIFEDSRRAGHAESSGGLRLAPLGQIFEVVQVLLDGYVAQGQRSLSEVCQAGYLLANKLTAARDVRSCPIGQLLLRQFTVPEVSKVPTGTFAAWPPILGWFQPPGDFPMQVFALDLQVCMYRHLNLPHT